MATSRRQSPTSLKEQLIDKPQAFEFLQALLILEGKSSKVPPLGLGSNPNNEAVRLRGPLTPTFAASQIQWLDDKSEQIPILSTAIFGLGGPDGPLPYAYQDWLQQRARLKDHAPAEFLDLFQNRLLAQLYQVLRRHRLALGFKAPTEAPAQQILLALSGLLPKALRNRLAVSDTAITTRAQLFNGPRRSLAGLAALIRQQFQLKVGYEHYQGAWRQIPTTSCSILMRGGRNLSLGRTAIAGSHVWDEHAGIRLTLGPLSPEQAEAYLPNGAQHQALADLTGLYLGPDLDCHLRLQVGPNAPLTLSHKHKPRLRWSSQLLRAHSPQPQQIDLRLRHKDLA